MGKKEKKEKKKDKNEKKEKKKKKKKKSAIQPPPALTIPQDSSTVFAPQLAAYSGIPSINEVSSFGNIGQVASPVKKWGRETYIAMAGIATTLITAILIMGAVRSTSKSLNQTKEAFISQTSPNLQIQDIKRKGDTVYFSIANLGQYPAKIETAEVGFMSLDMKVYGMDSTNPAKFALMTDYGLADATLSRAFLSSTSPITKAIVKNNIVKNLGQRLDNQQREEKDYLFGQISYIDRINKKSRLYYFNILLPPDGKPAYAFVSNENKDLVVVNEAND